MPRQPEPLAGKGYGKEEWEARWQTSRPGYVREQEPQAHPGAWPSVDPVTHVDEGEQRRNRELFFKGRGRKGPVPIVSKKPAPASEERKKAG